MEKNVEVIIFGDDRHSYLQTDKTETNFISVIKVHKPNKIVTGDGTHFLVWKGSNKLEFYSQSQGNHKFELEGEKIVDIVSGCESYLIPTESGKLYSVAQGRNHYSQNPTTNPESSKFSEIRLVEFFSRKNLLIKAIGMGYGSNYFLCTDGSLYVSGSYQSGRLGISKQRNQQVPLLLTQNVERVFSGPHGLGFFYITKSKILFGCGYNAYGQLGLGINNTKTTPKEVKLPPFQIEDLLDMYTGQTHSIALTNKGKVYTCGSGKMNGHNENKNKFACLQFFQDKFVVRIASAENTQLALTRDSGLYCWGLKNTTLNEISTWTIPTKLKVPKYFKVSAISTKINCGTKVVFLYNTIGNCLRQDFVNLLKSGKFTDTSIGSSENAVKCHKLLIELRTGLKINVIQQIMKDNNFTKEQINVFLKWVYSDEISYNNAIQGVFNSLNIAFPINKDNTLENTLLKLYEDEDSKDFNILVKIDDDDDNDDDDEEDEEEEEIPVHKLILMARSGLFREMFENIQEMGNNSVRDYSHKSIESLEVLIKYFYTNKIELTADDDPQLIVEELEDSIEYYQLNQDSNFKIELQKIKAQFNLKF
ncbi:btk-binding protein-related [Anaeramoeba flamelloides]|uniref:Btk-binding protein-related n=1 Tax=Anaeramoeba flamelloides TaxID=1746091 RepID=A0AAV8A7C3_9EUKA|nr:btk-binding protein-related [Anaeramoeba flamelloides]